MDRPYAFWKKTKGGEVSLPEKKQQSSGEGIPAAVGERALAVIPWGKREAGVRRDRKGEIRFIQEEKKKGGERGPGGKGRGP